ncbi:helix-turn-helix domain-containing protein [Parasphingorhabdus pacifica]
MSTSHSSPTALRRWVAGEMTKLRETGRFSRAEAAEVIGGSVQAIGHIENGRSLPGPLQLERLLEFYGVPERAEFFRELRTLAKKGRDWWIDFDLDDRTLPEYFKLFLGLEAMAEKIDSWDVQVVPGLFQTRDYARTLIRSGDPQLSAAGVDRRTELRMARQQEVLQSGTAPSVGAVLDEAALRRSIGGPAVMREQLWRLVELAEHPNIDLQVLPFQSGGHPGTEGAFTLLTYPAEFESDPGTVYAETRVKGIYYENPETVLRYREVLTRVRDVACTPSETPHRIEQAAKEL